MKPSPLLTFSPELQRNLWLELSPGRLIGMALIIGLITGGLYGIIGEKTVYPTLASLLWLLLILWGTRLAVDTISEEVAGRTWDVQRLSAQKATGLVLGKFFGGTVYVWYGAALCLAGILIITPEHARNLPDRFLEGLLAQAMAMFAALILMRFGSGTGRRIGNLGAQFIGIVFAGCFSSGVAFVLGDIAHETAATVAANSTMHWYGYEIATATFLRCLEAAMVLWLLLGMIRLVRRELGFRDGPLGWLCFVLFFMVLSAGFKSFGARYGESPSAIETYWQLRAFVAAHAVTYVALLGLPTGVAASRKLMLLLRARAWRSVWSVTPPWTMSAALSVIAAVAYATTGLEHCVFAFASLGFLLRDVIVIYGFRTRYVRRSESALATYFALVYLVGPFFTTNGFGFRDLDQRAFPSILLPLFAPFPGDFLLFAIVPWVEAAIAYALFRPDFRSMYRPIVREDVIAAKPAV